VILESAKQVIKVETLSCHHNLAGAPGPLRARPVDVEFEPVAIGISEIKGFAYDVVRCTLEWMIVPGKPEKGVREAGARRKTDGHMEKPGSARWSRSGFGIPGELDQGRSSRRGREGGVGRSRGGDLESEHAMVKIKSAP
jgi:hypothetical protein